MKLSIPSTKGNFMSNSKQWVLPLFLLSAFTSTSFASFDIYDEDSDGYYGSGQTRPFKDAIESTEPLTAYDRAFLESVDETRITERTYGRVLVGKSKVTLNNLTNNSSQFLDTYVLSTGSVGDNLYQLAIDIGHIWEQWAFELEFLFSKQLSYTTNPLLVGISPVIGTYSTVAQVELNAYALLANIEYIIPRFISFYPSRLQIHLDAGAGAVMLISNVTGTVNAGNIDPGGGPSTILPLVENTSTRKYPAIGMLGIGARYQISPHFLTGVTYRYYNMGKSSYGPVQNVVWQSNQLRYSGFYLDLTYQY
jgi:hypothetical protein